MDYAVFTLSTKGMDPLQLRDELLLDESKRLIVDADKLICKKQLQVAISRADRAFQQGNNIANVWGIELVLHLTGNHQISQALEIVGISKTTKNILIIQEETTLPYLNAISGMDVGVPSQELIAQYQLTGNNPCLDIISKGVRFISDHE